MIKEGRMKEFGITLSTSDDVVKATISHVNKALRCMGLTILEPDSARPPSAWTLVTRPAGVKRAEQPATGVGCLFACLFVVVVVGWWAGVVWQLAFFFILY
jgi:hypothetical protein